MKPNDLKAYELNEQDMTNVTGGFIEPAPSAEEIFQDLFGDGAKVEPDHLADPVSASL